MKMKCAKCAREMDGTEFIMYTGGSLIKTLKPILMPILKATLKKYFLIEAKGMGDSGLAGRAKACGLKCPKCNKKVDWLPFPELPTLKPELEKKEALKKKTT